MRIDSQILQNIAFFFRNADDAQSGNNAAGTGFVVWVETRETGITHFYVVTNDHVKCKLPSHVRLSHYGENPDKSVELDEDKWTAHAKGDDVAVYYLGCRDVSSSALAASKLLSYAQAFEARYAGVGDECMMLGLFSPLPGSAKNRPVARFGNISAVPGEPVYVKPRGFKQECFLVEMRSHGGFSGSPVFLLPSLSLRSAPQTYDMGRDETLGICCGHLEETTRKVKVAYPSAPEGFIAVEVGDDAGMAIVVPAWKIQEVLDLPDVIAARIKAEVGMPRAKRPRL